MHVVLWAPGLHRSLGLGSGSPTWGRIPRRAPLIGWLRQVGPMGQSAAARPWAAGSVLLVWRVAGGGLGRDVPGKDGQHPGMSGVPHIQPGTPLALRVTSLSPALPEGDGSPLCQPSSWALDPALTPPLASAPLAPLAPLELQPSGLPAPFWQPTNSVVCLLG